MHLQGVLLKHTWVKARLLHREVEGDPWWWENEVLNHKLETWGRDSAKQVSVQCNLSGTTATISHIFLDSLLGERVQEDSSLALTVLCAGDTKSRIRQIFQDTHNLVNLSAVWVPQESSSLTPCSGALASVTLPGRHRACVWWFVAQRIGLCWHQFWNSFSSLSPALSLA